MIIPPLIEPGLLQREGYLKYHLIVAITNALVQLVGIFVHTYGLATGGRTLFTDCFQVDVGGVWYTVVANGGGFIELSMQCYITWKLIKQQSEYKPASDLEIP